MSDLFAGPATLRDLFDSDKVYRAPVFQRYFVWKAAKQLPLLWNDIDQVMSGQAPTRFLGAIVLQEISTAGVNAPRSYWLIDGQQRLTTLYLFLIALGKVAQDFGEPDMAADLARLWLLNQTKAHRGHPKLLPTTQDLSQFRDALSNVDAVPLILPAKQGEPEGKLSRMYRQICADIADRVRMRGLGYLQELADTVLLKLRFVHIILSDDDDAQEIFDILNTRGILLETSDLVRNLVFQKFRDDSKAAEAFFFGHWQPFENDMGRESLSSFFFPFTLIHKEGATKATVFEELRIRWAKKSPVQILADIKQYTNAFRCLTNRTLELDAPEPLRRAVWNLARMPAPSVSLPYTMRVVHEWEVKAISAKTATQALAVVDSFLVRRGLVGLEPTGLHAVFKRLWGHAKADARGVVTEIDRSKTIEFPDDERFANSIRTGDLYSRKIRSYVLDAYDRDIPGMDPISITAVPVSIDHIMPQSRRSPHWRKAISESAYQELIDTWANLVPISLPHNIRKQDWEWSKVRTFYRTKASWNSPRLVAEQNRTWGEPAIRRRASVITEWALQRWPKPAPK